MRAICVRACNYNCNCYLPRIAGLVIKINKQQTTKATNNKTTNKASALFLVNRIADAHQTRAFYNICEQKITKTKRNTQTIKRPSALCRSEALRSLKQTATSLSPACPRHKYIHIGRRTHWHMHTLHAHISMHACSLVCIKRSVRVCSLKYYYTVQQ